MSKLEDEKAKKALLEMLRKGVKAKVPYTVLVGPPSNLDFMREVVDEAAVEEEIEIFTDPQADTYTSLQRDVFDEYRSRNYPEARSQPRSREHTGERSALSTSERVQQLLTELAECFADLDRRVKELERRNG